MDKRQSYELSQEEMAYIVHYLNDELEHSQREVFELQLMRDEEFRQKVEEVKILLIGIREHNLAQQMKDFHQSAGEDSGLRLSLDRKVIPFVQKRWVAAVAAIIILSGIFGVWFNMSSPDRLYRSYFVPDIGLPVEMGSGDNVQYTFFDGMISYKEGNYIDALAKWKHIPARSGEADTLQYYRGMAYMGVGDIDSAIVQLLPVAGERESVFYEPAIWYLSLCYLNQGELQKTIALLKRIPGYIPGQELLKKLE